MPVLDHTGERLAAAAAVDLALAPDAMPESISNAKVIAINFSTLKDGRGFSLARVLRSRLGFAGDLRAVGAFIPDQAAFLVRCGFTSFTVAENFDDAAFRLALSWFPRAYQRPLAAEESIIDRRRLEALTARYAAATAQELLAAAVTREFAGRITLVSSFGAESAVLLHMVSRVDPKTPVLFLDTGKLFGETLRYRNALVALLGLSNVVTVAPESKDVAARDGKGVLWSTDADACCALRKVEPLTKALEPFAAWITGRKGYQSAERRGLAPIELAEGKFKINPLVAWARADVLAYLDAHHLPRHPLEQDGYLSIGCTPCTDRVNPGEDARAGRWRGRDKTECGIHRAPQSAAS
jgi:phosphoadenosine phosphosulfate reductase